MVDSHATPRHLEQYHAEGVIIPSPPKQQVDTAVHVQNKVLQNHLTHICAETTCSDQYVPIKGYLEQNVLSMKNYAC